jgi:uncharacterized protein YuzE
MAVRQLEISKEKELLKLAGERVKLPNRSLQLKYQPDVDLLVVRLNDGKSTYSEDDMEKGLIYNYDAQNRLVSIEVLDLYGVFV